MKIVSLADTGGNLQSFSPIIAAFQDRRAAPDQSVALFEAKPVNL